jgi:hypothetical protein
MPRYSSKSRDEVADKHDDRAQRRTVPGDVRPFSPERIDRLYAKGKETISRKEWFHETHQANQFIEDHHDNARGRYDNDVPEKSWLRGGGEGHRPNMDVGKLDVSNRPPKVPTGLEANGRDMTSSPLSAARETWIDPRSKDWG